MSWREFVRFPERPKRDGDEPRKTQGFTRCRLSVRREDADAIVSALIRLYAGTHDEFFAEQAGMLRDHLQLWTTRCRAGAGLGIAK